MQQSKQEEKSARLKYVFRCGITMLAIGIMYGVFVKLTGVGIPCVFHSVTGLKCPSCGITHLAIYLMQGQIGKAYASNSFVFILLPVLTVIGIRYCYRYIQFGQRRIGKHTATLVYVMIGLLIVWGIVRNI